MRQSYDIAAALGQAELEIGNYPDAAKYVAFAVQHFAPSESEAALLNIKNRFAEIQAKVGTLLVEVRPSSARVRVDGTPVLQPPFGPEIFVSPGDHVVEVEEQGRSTRRTVSVAAGARQIVSLEIGNPPANVSISERIEPSRPSPAQPAPSLVPVVISGAVAVTGLTLGVVFEVEASAEYDRLEQQRAALSGDPGQCRSPGARSSGCAELDVTSKRYDRNRNAATVSFAAAGVGALFGLGYWLFTRPARSTTGNALRVLPAAGPGAFGIAADATF